MTEKDNNQSHKSENITSDESSKPLADRTEKLPHARSTFDLRSAAEEAIQMLNESQKMASEQPELSDEDSTAKISELKRSEVDDIKTHTDEPPAEKPIDIGSTTHDVSDHAQEAMAMPNRQSHLKNVVKTLT